MKKKQKMLLGGLAALVLIGLACAGTAYYLLLAPQFHPSKTSYIYIDRDDNIDSVCHKLKTQGKAASLSGFKLLARYREYGQHIRTGRYAIRPADNAYHVFSRLYRGYQEPMNLTIGSVRTLDRLARNVGKQLMIDSAEIANLLNDTMLIRQWGYQKETLPCLFIPDTYQIYWDISAEQFVERMQKEHSHFWNEERKQKAQAAGMTPEEVCTLASIVEEETNNNAEKPTVAGLYINRLHKDMPLQADPTVKFALQDFQLKRISNKHLTVDSPYNTYRNIGLPPGPIRIPTPVGIDAVLNYEKHDYIYMCAKEDFSGTHNFASNYTEHMKNARKYWKALNERKIFK